MIVFYNNDLEVYDIDGRLIQNKELDQGVTQAVQDEDSIIFTYDNGTLGVYDWNADKMLDELEGFGITKSLNLSTHRKVPTKDRLLVAGGENGELMMFKQK